MTPLTTASYSRLTLRSCSWGNEIGVRFEGFRNHHQPGGVFVETVDNARAGYVFELWAEK